MRLVLFSVYISSQKLSKKIQSHWILEAGRQKKTKEGWILPLERINDFRASKTLSNCVAQQACFSHKETEDKKDKALQENNQWQSQDWIRRDPDSYLAYFGVYFYYLVSCIGFYNCITQSNFMFWTYLYKSQMDQNIDWLITFSIWTLWYGAFFLFS